MKGRRQAAFLLVYRTLVSLPRRIEFDAGGCPARRSLLRSPSLDFALRASLRLFQFAPGELVLRGQEKVTKEVAPAHPCARDIRTSLYFKAASPCATCRMHECRVAHGCARAAFSSFQAVRATREAKTASLKHALTYPEMTAMLGCVHGAGVTLATQINHSHFNPAKNHKKTGDPLHGPPALV